jgi:hypothetical protein
MTNTPVKRLTVVQTLKLIHVATYAASFVLPTVVFWLLLPGYYWQIALAVTTVNLAIRYGKRSVKWAKAVTEQRGAAKLAKDASKREAMFYFITPSIFTRRYGNLEGVPEKTYVDDPPHWVIAIRLFFDPFYERQDSIPRDFLGLIALQKIQTLTKATAFAWLLGWIACLLLPLVEALLSMLSHWTGENMHLPVLAIPLAASTMTIWTVAWAMYTLRLWRRERFTVTAVRYAVTSRRLPFQNGKNQKGLTSFLTSVTMTQTFVGRVLGYGHFTFESWHDPEPITERRFVRDPDRVKTILDHFVEQNDHKERPIDAHRP